MYQNPISKSFHDALSDGNRGELEFTEVACEGDGDEPNRALEDCGENYRPCGAPCRLRLLPALLRNPDLHCYSPLNIHIRVPTLLYIYTMYLFPWEKKLATSFGLHYIRVYFCGIICIACIVVVKAPFGEGASDYWFVCTKSFAWVCDCVLLWDPATCIVKEGQFGWGPLLAWNG